MIVVLIVTSLVSPNVKAVATWLFPWSSGLTVTERGLLHQTSHVLGFSLGLIASQWYPTSRRGTAGWVIVMAVLAVSLEFARMVYT